MRNHVQELAHQIQTFSRDVGYLEDWAYPLADELCLCSLARPKQLAHGLTAYSGIDTILAVLDEYGDFPSTRGFQYLGELRYRLLPDVRRANVDFGNDAHYRHIERQCYTKMLSACS